MSGILRNPPGRIAAYLWAQLVYIPFVFCSAWYFGVWSKAYAFIYCFFTGLILYAVAGIAFESLATRHYRLRASAIALLFAAILTKIAFTGVLRPLTWYAAISLTEGFILAWAGVLCLFVSPYTRRPDLIFTLAALWLCQAAFRFGWVLHFETWQALNWLVPPALGLACFTFLAWRLSLRSGPLGHHPRY